jgi:hypothetical protein
VCASLPCAKAPRSANPKLPDALAGISLTPYDPGDAFLGFPSCNVQENLAAGSSP